MYVSCCGDGVSEPAFNEGFDTYLAWRAIRCSLVTMFSLVFIGENVTVRLIIRLLEALFFCVWDAHEYAR